MQAAILYHLPGVDGDATIETDTDDTYPHLVANEQQYLDGRSLYYGTAADRIEVETTVPIIADGAISTERASTMQPAVVDWYADLADGWVGVSSSDGEFMADLLAIRNDGRPPEAVAIDLDDWAGYLRDRDRAAVEGYNYSIDTGDDDDDGSERAGAAFGDDAHLRDLPDRGNRLVLFRYPWHENWVRGAVAASGYVAVYENWAEAVFAKWLSEEVLRFAVPADEDGTTQLELGQTAADTGGVAGE